MIGHERIKRRSNSHQGRSAKHLALQILRKRGLLAIRSAEPDTLVHLIAWENGVRPTLIRVKRIRQPVLSAREVIHRWPYEVSQLRRVLVLGSVQIWVFSGFWQYYEVLKGGVTEVGA